MKEGRNMLTAKKISILLFLNLSFIIVLQSCSVSQENALKAVSSGRISAVRKFIKQKNNNQDAADSYGNTLCHLAVSSGQNDILKLLIEYKADLNRPNDGGDTPLHLAACSNNVEAVKILIAAGVDPDQRNPKNGNKTALHYAAINNAVKVADYLISSGDDINILCGEKASPALWAAYMGSKETLAFFIEKGADTSVIDTFGIGILGRAKLGSRQDNYEYLKSIGLN